MSNVNDKLNLKKNKSRLTTGTRISKFRPTIVSNLRSEISKSSIGSFISGKNTGNILQYEIILLGDAAVGKTSVLKRLVYDSFSDFPLPSMSIDSKPVTLKIDEDGSLADLLVWDTCGFEKFNSIGSSYYKRADGILIIFDISNKKSFENISAWIKEIENHIEKKNSGFRVPIHIVGNKNDIEFAKREVSWVEADNWSTQNGFKYHECSAKNGMNINYIFEEITMNIGEKRAEKTQIIDETRHDIKSKDGIHEGYDNNNSTKLDVTKHSNNPDKKRSDCCLYRLFH